VTPRSNEPQRPADGEHLPAAIDLALKQLRIWAEWNDRGGFEAMTNPDALLWRELLRRSQSDLHQGVAPRLRRSVLQQLGIDDLTRRRWARFLTWFWREIEPHLSTVCRSQGVTPIYPGRASNAKGGSGPSSEAVYFLSLQLPADVDALEEAGTPQTTAESSGNRKSTDPTKPEEPRRKWRWPLGRRAASAESPGLLGRRWRSRTWSRTGFEAERATLMLVASLAVAPPAKRTVACICVCVVALIAIQGLGLAMLHDVIASIDDFFGVVGQVLPGDRSIRL